MAKEAKKGGMMMYSIANEQCNQFGVCTNSGGAKVNERLITLLYAGRSELTAVNCPPLHKTAKEIEMLLQVPLIQSTLSHMLNTGSKPSGGGGSFGALYAFSRSILPYIEEADREAAQVIARNIDFQLQNQPSNDSLDAATKALKGTIPKMGVDCDLVGRLDGRNVCASPASSRSGSVFWSLLLCAGLSLLGMVVAIVL
uniref:Uncharacterized protein n=1 Tax=Helicotheca tamesis TaxID=374047 RepID=A0A7S2GRA8_9STRA